MLKNFERKMYQWLRINGLTIQHLDTEDHHALFLDCERAPKEKKFIIAWDDFNEEYQIYNYYEWSSYIEQWSIKNKDKIVKRILG